MRRLVLTGIIVSGLCVDARAEDDLTGAGTDLPPAMSVDFAGFSGASEKSITDGPALDVGTARALQTDDGRQIVDVRPLDVAQAQPLNAIVDSPALPATIDATEQGRGMDMRLLDWTEKKVWSGGGPGEPEPDAENGENPEFKRRRRTAFEPPGADPILDAKKLSAAGLTDLSTANDGSLETARIAFEQALPMDLLSLRAYRVSGFSSVPVFVASVRGTPQDLLRAVAESTRSVPDVRVAALARRTALMTVPLEIAWKTGPVRDTERLVVFVQPMLDGTLALVAIPDDHVSDVSRVSTIGRAFVTPATVGPAPVAEELVRYARSISVADVGRISAGLDAGGTWVAPRAAFEDATPIPGSTVAPDRTKAGQGATYVVDAAGAPANNGGFEVQLGRTKTSILRTIALFSKDAVNVASALPVSVGGRAAWRLTGVVPGGIGGALIPVVEYLFPLEDGSTVVADVFARAGAVAPEVADRIVAEVRVQDRAARDGVPSALLAQSAIAQGNPAAAASLAMPRAAKPAVDVEFAAGEGGAELLGPFAGKLDTLRWLPPPALPAGARDLEGRKLELLIGPVASRFDFARRGAWYGPLKYRANAGYETVVLVSRTSSPVLDAVSGLGRFFDRPEESRLVAKRVDLAGFKAWSFDTKVRDPAIGALRAASVRAYVVPLADGSTVLVEAYQLDRGNASTARMPQPWSDGLAASVVQGLGASGDAPSSQLITQAWQRGVAAKVTKAPAEGGFSGDYLVGYGTGGLLLGLKPANGVFPLLAMLQTGNIVAPENADGGSDPTGSGIDAGLHYRFELPPELLPVPGLHVEGSAGVHVALASGVGVGLGLRAAVAYDLPIGLPVALYGQLQSQLYFLGPIDGSAIAAGAGIQISIP